MQTLVISDLHLTPEFEEKRFRFLHDLISQADMVVLNGDFWEGYECSFSTFLVSPWRELFPLLKKKNSIYIYGNHDKESMCDERVMQFSAIQGWKHSLHLNGTQFHFEHGHVQAPLIDDRFLFVQRTPLINKISRTQQKIIMNVLGPGFFETTFRSLNSKIKKTLPLDRENQFWFFGHTHSPENDLQGHFVNTGFFRFGYGGFAIIKNGLVTFQMEKYS